MNNNNTNNSNAHDNGNAKKRVQNQEFADLVGSELEKLRTRCAALEKAANQPSQHTQTTQFEIFVSKDTFKFNASHFVAYPGFRERLHGHSYRASVKLLGSHEIGRDGYVLDFGCVKTAAKDVCKTLNEYFLVPMLR